MENLAAWIFGAVCFGLISGGGWWLLGRLLRKWDGEARIRADAIHAAHMQALLGGSRRVDDE